MAREMDPTLYAPTRPSEKKPCGQLPLRTTRSLSVKSPLTFCAKKFLTGRSFPGKCARERMAKKAGE